MGNIASVNGFMFAASAFITVAGILLAIGSGERLGRMASISLGLSIVFGTALIITALAWLGKPPTSLQLGWIFISLQWITFYFPLSKLVLFFSSK